MVAMKGNAMAVLGTVEAFSPVVDSFHRLYRYSGFSFK
jgi:hypothetical protein